MFRRKTAGRTKPFLLLAKLSRNKAGLSKIPVKQRGSIMLSEKFILVLEAVLKSNGRGFPDGAPRVVSTSPHVPVKLPAACPKASPREKAIPRLPFLFDCAATPDALVHDI
jgi:hypothetical protein